jgi:hypothetical protein
MKITLPPSSGGGHLDTKSKLQSLLGNASRGDADSPAPKSKLEELLNKSGLLGNMSGAAGDGNDSQLSIHDGDNNLAGAMQFKNLRIFVSLFLFIKSKPLNYFFNNKRKS